jgi:hypothetical protein
MRDFRVAIMAISDAAKKPLAMIRERIIAASNQMLSRTIFGHSYFTKAGRRTGGLSRVRDLNGAAQIGRDQNWPGGLDISGFTLIKASATGKGKAHPFQGVQGSMFQVQARDESLSGQLGSRDRAEGAALNIERGTAQAVCA